MEENLSGLSGLSGFELIHKFNGVTDNTSVKVDLSKYKLFYMLLNNLEGIYNNDLNFLYMLMPVMPPRTTYTINYQDSIKCALTGTDIRDMTFSNTGAGYSVLYGIK